MKATVQPVELRREEPDLIDRIANAMPAELRADYYRELRHCRSLPENDEMLRVLRAMQFLVLLIEGAPARLGHERELVEGTLNRIRDELRESLDAGQQYHSRLEERLTGLPEEIAKGISPEAIAGTIKENLRQQFIRSTLPEIAEALAANSQQLTKICGEFAAASRKLSDSYDGAAKDARSAVTSIRSEISAAAAAAKQATDEQLTFHTAYRWTAYSLSGLAVVIGFALGLLTDQWIMSAPKPVAEAPAPVVQAAPRQATKPKNRR
jgi:hypothetical protein